MAGLRRQNKAVGYTLGIIASVCYGLNPFFAIPQYAQGMTTESVLIYRYLFAVALTAIVMLLRRESFRLTLRQVFLLAGMGVLFGLSSLTLFLSYNYLDSGIASTILFTYPLFVALLMAAFFHERLRLHKVVALFLAFIGISLLYHGEGGTTLHPIGVLLVIASSLSYAFYIIGVNKGGLHALSSYQLTFYAMLFGLLFFLVILVVRGQALQPLSTPMLWLDSLGLGLFPTFMSMVFIAQSIRIVGETPAAILGALEPLTALAVSVMVFGGVLTATNCVGILLVLLAVLLTTTGGLVRRCMRHR